MTPILEQASILRLTGPALEKTGIRHGFFGRTGGVSQGIYASLNCGVGSGDDQASIAENRSRVASQMGGGVLHTLYQCHTNEAVIIKGRVPEDFGRPKADALVTNVPGIILGILTADCTPVLFADPKARVIGAAHAGWKGAVSGVLATTVKGMEELGAKRGDIVAVIGPCIQQSSYEVGPEFRDHFISEEKDNGKFFIPSKQQGKWMFGLPAYVRRQLEKLALGQVEDTAQDTLSDPGRFFSYRRACLSGEKDYGRQVSAIRL
jgi:YfiH family protein